MLKILDKEIHRGDKFIVDCALSDNDGRTALLPYYVIAGHADGPVLCITSGVHGTEYPGIGANLITTLIRHSFPELSSACPSATSLPSKRKCLL